jgi:phage tail protein X
MFVRIRTNDFDLDRADWHPSRHYGPRIARDRDLGTIAQVMRVAPLFADFMKVLREGSALDFTTEAVAGRLNLQLQI